MFGEPVIRRSVSSSSAQRGGWLSDVRGVRAASQSGIILVIDAALNVIGIA
jgi:hypothetical protein